MKLKVTVEGKSYEVEVEITDVGHAPTAPAQVVARTAPAAAPAPAAKPAAPAPKPTAPVAAGAGEVNSPMAGTILAITVKVGDKVNAGETVMVLEAMKMETNLAAPATGTIKEILVAAGQAVQAGQKLLVVG